MGFPDAAPAPASGSISLFKPDVQEKTSLHVNFFYVRKITVLRNDRVGGASPGRDFVINN